MRFHFFCLDPIFFHSSTFVVRVRFVYFLSLAVVVKPVGRLVIKFHFDNQSIFCAVQICPVLLSTPISAICLKGASALGLQGRGLEKLQTVLPRKLLPFVRANRHSTNVAQVHFVCYHNTCQTAMWRHSLQLCQPFLHRYERVAVADIVNLRR